VEPQQKKQQLNSFWSQGVNHVQQRKSMMTDHDRKNNETEPAAAAVREPAEMSVGYGKPPLRHRFRKGKSGFPRGRPKGDRNAIALFKEIAREKVRVRLGDEVRIMTRAEAVIHANYAASLKKNANAAANMFLLAEEAREFVDVSDEKQVAVGIGAPAGRLTTEEWLEVFGPPRGPGESEP
jgi:hypothetical protein